LHYLVSGLAWLALLAGFGLTVFAPELAHQTMLVIMALALLLVFWMPQQQKLWRHPAAWMPLLAGALLLLAFTVTAQSPIDMAAVLVFVHLFLVAPLAGLFKRLGRALTLERAAAFGLLGAVGGAAVAITDVYVFGAERAGLVNNPIHLADLALMVGFVALLGLWGKSRWRWVFLMGPVLSLVTVWLTGSLGPLAAALPMLGVAAASLAFSVLPARLAWRGMAITTAILAVSGIGLVIAFASQMQWVLAQIMADNSTAERLTMYTAASKAFLASPWFGHGLIDYFAAAKAHMPAGVQLPDYAHLHNDVADFAVAAGAFGIVAYGLIVLAPLVGAWHARAPLRLPLLYLGTVTTIGYFAMGLTNAVLGLRWQDIVFATILALIIALSQQAEDVSP
jgi:O-antigen ligase